MQAPAAVPTGGQQQSHHGLAVPPVQDRARHPDNKKRPCLFCTDAESAFVVCDGCLPYWKDQSAADVRDGITQLLKTYRSTRDIGAYNRNIDAVFRPACKVLRDCFAKAESARSIRAVQSAMQGAATFDAAINPIISGFTPVRMSPHPFAAAAPPAPGGFFSGQLLVPPAGILGGPTHSPHFLTTAQQLLLPFAGGMVQGGLGAANTPAVPSAGPVASSEGGSPAGAAPQSREAEIRAIVREELVPVEAKLRQVIDEEVASLHQEVVQKLQKKSKKRARQTRHGGD